MLSARTARKIDAVRASSTLVGLIVRRAPLGTLGAAPTERSDASCALVIFMEMFQVAFVILALVLVSATVPPTAPPVRTAGLALSETRSTVVGVLPDATLAHESTPIPHGVTE
jgi:hypothetical protein